MKRAFVVLGALALLSACAGSALASDPLFTWESVPYGTFPSVSETVGGLTATASPLGGGTLTVTGPLGPASWADKSLIYFFGGGSGLVVDFSAPVSSASIQFGDYDADEDLVFLNAYSGPGGTGTLLASGFYDYPASADISAGDSAVASLTVTAPGIESIVATSGGAFPGSIYWDNVSAETDTTVVPEPASLTLLGVAAATFAGVTGWRRRRTA